MQGLPFPIITYQVITGNYSDLSVSITGSEIITYQVITGNYSFMSVSSLSDIIITYQVITGNYSYNVLWESSDNILKKYKWKRKSLAITPSDVNIFSQTSETLNGTAFKNIISCAKAAHDRHSPFAECINAFFSLALIISYPCNVRTRHPLLQPFCCFALLSQTHSLYSILSAFHPPLTLCKASYQVLSLLNDLFCFLFVC